jgi:hypothetical protein
MHRLTRQRRAWHRHTWLAAAALLVACGGTAGRAASTPLPTATSTPAPAQVSPATALTTQPNRLWVLDNAHTAVTAVDATTQATAVTLPVGVADARWARMYSMWGVDTLIVSDAASGAQLDRIAVDSGLDLPYGVGSGMREGLSPGGSRLVLTDRPGDPSVPVKTTRFRLYDTAALHRAPQAISLQGQWQFDGIDDAGRNLYLLHYTVPQSGQYEVRRYDLVADRLDSNPVAEKGSPSDGPMTGAAFSRVTTADNAWQLTAYGFGQRGPFLHALGLVDQYAFCIDLGPDNRSNEALDMLWSLVRSHDGHSVIAVNGATGRISVFDAAPPFNARTAMLPVPPSPTAAPAAWWTLGSTTVADAKRGVIGGAVLSADDRTLYAIGDNGIAVIDVATLTLRRWLVPDQPFQAITLNPDGHTLYAVSTQESTGVVQIDVATGGALRLPSFTGTEAVLRVTPSR